MRSIDGDTGVLVTARRRTKLACGAVVASVVWLLAASAAAQVPQRPLPERSVEGDGPPRMMPAEQRSEPSAAPDAAAPRGGNRLSPEARRQLRRDIHEAGRDLYPGRMHPGHREPRRP